MQVLFSPQFSGKTIEYEFYKDTVRAKTDAATVFFDFRKVEEGKSYQVNHELVLSVERIDGELRLTLLDFICEDCPQERKFPELSVVIESEFVLGDDVIKPSEVAVTDSVDEVTKLKEQISFLESCLMEVASVIYD